MASRLSNALPLNLLVMGPSMFPEFVKQTFSHGQKTCRVPEAAGLIPLFFSPSLSTPRPSPLEPHGFSTTRSALCRGRGRSGAAALAASREVSLRGLGRAAGGRVVGVGITRWTCDHLESAWDRQLELSGKSVRVFFFFWAKDTSPKYFFHYCFSPCLAGRNFLLE